MLHITKEQIIEAINTSKSYEQAADKLRTTTVTLRQKRRQFDIADIKIAKTYIDNTEIGIAKRKSDALRYIERKSLKRVEIVATPIAWDAYLE